MKKIYFSPEMEVLEIKTTCMLAASLPLSSDIEIEDAGYILAPPGLDLGSNVPGVPSFMFE